MRARGSEGLARVAQSLDPKRPLRQGFALVRAGGALVRSVDQARDAGAVVLTFADGDVAAQIGDVGGKGTLPPSSPPPERPPTRPAKTKAAASPPTKQQDLFG